MFAYSNNNHNGLGLATLGSVILLAGIVFGNAITISGGVLMALGLFLEAKGAFSLH